MRLIISSGAQRDMRRLSHEVAERVRAAIDSLEQDPRPRGCVLLRERRPPTWRVRVGPWRILYQIDDEGAVLTITGVRHRAQAYRSG